VVPLLERSRLEAPCAVGSFKPPNERHHHLLLADFPCATDRPGVVRTMGSALCISLFLLAMIVLLGAAVMVATLSL